MAGWGVGCGEYEAAGEIEPAARAGIDSGE